jgi:hypothetical protein
VSLERGPLSLVSATEELLGRKSSGSGPENRDYSRRGSAALTTPYPYIRKSWLTSPTSGGRSVGIVRLRTKAMELVSQSVSSFNTDGYLQRNGVLHTAYLARGQYR